MKILFISIGKENDENLSEVILDYTRRIEKYSEVSDFAWKILPSIQTGDEKSVKNKESEAILKSFDEKDFVVALDEKGKELSTEGLKDFLDKRISSGVKRLVFIIGGSYGLGADVLNRANLIWSLSPLTFPHKIVRLILSEAVYRALSFRRGEPYHHN